MFISILAMIVLLPIMFYTPGRVATHFLKMQGERSNLYSCAGSTLIYSAVAILAHLFGVSLAIVVELIASSTLIVVISFTIQESAVLQKARAFVSNQAVLILAAGYGLRVLLSGLIPNFWRGGDWYFFHYETSLAFMSRTWIISPDRTPMFSLICALFMSVFGNEFWVAQITGDLLNSLFLIPSYYICKQLYGRNTAMSALVFLSVLPYFSYNAIYFWPKLFAAYFVLLSFYELLAIIHNTRVNWPLYMLSTGLAILAHQYAVLFGASGVLVALIYRKVEVSRFLRGLIYLSVIMFPWWLYNQLTFGFPIGNCMLPQDCVKYYPFAVGGEFNGIPPAISTTEFYRRFFATPISTIISIRIYNLLVTFAPLLGLLEKYVAISYLPRIDVAAWGFEFVYQFYSVDTLFGALTISLSIFLLVSLRHALHNRTLKLLLTYVAISAVLMSLEWGWFMQGALGFGIAGLFPAFALLTIVSVAGLEKIGTDRAFVFIGSTFEMVLFYTFLWTTANSNQEEPTDVTLYHQFAQHWPLVLLVILILAFYFANLIGYTPTSIRQLSRLLKFTDRIQLISLSCGHSCEQVASFFCQGRHRLN